MQFQYKMSKFDINFVLFSKAKSSQNPNPIRNHKLIKNVFGCNYLL